MKIYVEGRLKKRSWQDREGNTRYNVEVIGDEMTILSKPDTDTKPREPYTVEVNQEISKMENLESDPEDTLPLNGNYRTPIQFNEYTHGQAGRRCGHFYVYCFGFIITISSNFKC